MDIINGMLFLCLCRLYWWRVICKYDNAHIFYYSTVCDSLNLFCTCAQRIILSTCCIFISFIAKGSLHHAVMVTVQVCTSLYESYVVFCYSVYYFDQLNFQYTLQGFMTVLSLSPLVKLFVTSEHSHNINYLLCL